MTRFETEFLIVGNCAAGVSAAEAIREAAPEAKVLIVSDEPYAAYGRPLISYIIEGVTDEGSIWLHDDDFYQKNDFQTLFGRDYRVVELDADGHMVNLAGGDQISYGKCLVATGSSPFVPETPGLGNQENVFTFTTLDQAKAAWAYALAATEKAHELGKASRLLISGAGLIGLKAAEAFADVVDEVVVVGRAPYILRAVLDPVAGPILQKHLEPHGVRCLTGVTASEYVGSDERITGAVLTDGTTVDCDLLIMAAGVRPNSAFAVAAGAEQGRGLVVDDRQQTTLPDVYAAGDVAQVINRLDGSASPLAQWPNAVRQGRVAGLAMTGMSTAKCPRGDFAVNATNFFETSVLTCGLTNPSIGAGYEAKVFADGDSYAKFVCKDDQLFGYVLLNRPENAGVYTQIITSKAPLSSFPGDIFENPVQNIDFPAAKRWAMLNRGCPQRYGACAEGEE